MSTKITRWWWVRHAPVPNMEGKLYGSDDVACDTSDVKAFKKLANTLPKKAFWIISHLSRTDQTANAIKLEGLKFPEPVVEPNIGEQYFGDWQGLKWSEMEKLDPIRYQKFWERPAHNRPPGGESFNDQVNRVSAVINQVNDEKAGETIVAIAHAGSIRAAIVHALNVGTEIGMSFSVENLSLTCLEYVDGGLLRGKGGSCRVVCVNRETII